MGSVAGSLVTNERATVLAAQNAECFEQIAKKRVRRSGSKVESDTLSGRQSESGKVGEKVNQRME